MADERIAAADADAVAVRRNAGNFPYMYRRRRARGWTLLPLLLTAAMVPLLLDTPRYAQQPFGFHGSASGGSGVD